MDISRQTDLRNSVRFPLHLPVVLKTPDGEYQANTRDISAGGLMFHLESAISLDSPVEFSIEMPAEVLGSERRILVNCKGRVVRCSQENAGYMVAVVIDEYQFERS